MGTRRATACRDPALLFAFTAASVRAHQPARSSGVSCSPLYPIKSCSHTYRSCACPRNTPPPGRLFRLVPRPRIAPARFLSWGPRMARVTCSGSPEPARRPRTRTKTSGRLAQCDGVSLPGVSSFLNDNRDWLFQAQPHRQHPPHRTVVAYPSPPPSSYPFPNLPFASPLPLLPSCRACRPSCSQCSIRSRHATPTSPSSSRPLKRFSTLWGPSSRLRAATSLFQVRSSFACRVLLLLLLFQHGRHAFGCGLSQFGARAAAIAVG